MTTDTKAKIVEWLRGERDWDQRDMARECLAEIERLDAVANTWSRVWSNSAAVGDLT